MNARLLKLGLVPYLKGKELQLKAVEVVKSGLADMILLTLQHPPVYTITAPAGLHHRQGRRLRKPAGAAGRA